MSQDLNNLYNQALTAIGHAGNVTDPKATTKQTAILNLWYPVARRAVLSANNWSSVRAFTRLSLARERASTGLWQDIDPAPGYQFAYALPHDCLRPRYLSDYSRFSVSNVGGERVINSNTPQAILHYTRDEPEPSKWDADLYQAILYSLSAAINMAHNGKPQLSQKFERQVFDLIGLAKVEDANADDEYFDSLPTLWAGADFSAPAMAQGSQFFYPTATFAVGAFSQ